MMYYTFTDVVAASVGTYLALAGSGRMAFWSGVVMLCIAIIPRLKK